MQSIGSWISSWFIPSRFTPPTVRTLCKGSPDKSSDCFSQARALTGVLEKNGLNSDSSIKIAQKIVNLQSDQKDLFCERNASLYKVIVLAKGVAFFLLPKKEPDASVSGTDKHGRMAFHGYIEAGGWKIDCVWNLTSRKVGDTWLPMFAKARQIEQKIPHKLLLEITPKLLYDFDVEGCKNKRTAYYVHYTSLTDLLNADGFVADQPRLLQIARSAANKLAMLHKAGFSWRDCKPDNILVDAANEVRFCDLDSCTDEVVELQGKRTGTCCYMPPETLNELRTNNKKRDVFAFGCLLYQMINDFQPEGTFPSVSGVQVKKDPTFSSIKQAFECLSEWARSENPDFRPDMDTIANLLLPDYPPG